MVSKYHWRLSSEIENSEDTGHGRENSRKRFRSKVSRAGHMRVGHMLMLFIPFTDQMCDKRKQT